MYQKVLPVLRNMADNPAISSLQLLTIVYYNNCYFVATTRLCISSKNCYPETALRGGGRKLGALVQTSIFRRTKMQKGGAYNRASTILTIVLYRLSDWFIFES